MTDCGICGDREGKFADVSHRRLKHMNRGALLLCHECAHEAGLGHSHTDPVYPLHPIHVVDLVGIELKDHLAAYLDEVRT